LSNPWKRLTLAITYRCTEPMVNFVNHCLLGEKRLIANRTSLYKPLYYVINPFEIKEEINNYIDRCLNTGYTNDDIAILAYSINNPKTPVNVIANFLSSKGKFIYKPMDDYSDISDDNLLKNKIVVSTIHQFKGRERKLVIVVGFDNGFYMSNPDASKIECPNLLYVAATRARERVIFIQDLKNGPLSFINLKNIDKYVEIKGPKPKFTNVSNDMSDSKTYSVTQLIKFLPDTLIEQLQNCWTIKSANFLQLSSINVQTSISFGPTMEDVSAIYGTAIPLIKQYYLQNYFLLMDKLESLKKEAKALRLERKLDDLLRESKTLKGQDQLIWLRMAYIINFYICVLERYIHPLNQIKDYDWFYNTNSMEAINLGLSRLAFLEKNDLFEKAVCYETVVNLIDDKELKVTIIGAIDCITEKYGPWEFKFINSFRPEHVLQTVIYWCLLYKSQKMDEINPPKIGPFNLFNIRTGENYQIEIQQPEVNVDLILKTVIEQKVKTRDICLDIEELQKQLTIYA